MKAPRISQFVVVTILSLLPLAAAAEHKQPTEAQCRQMVDEMLGIMKSTVKKVEKEKDKKEAQAVFERAEKIVKDNRARGATECESWGGIVNLVTRG
jgi:hypothetical protein